MRTLANSENPNEIKQKFSISASGSAPFAKVKQYAGIYKSIIIWKFL